jgi:hypothetical protein
MTFGKKAFADYLFAGNETDKYKGEVTLGFENKKTTKAKYDN